MGMGLTALRPEPEVNVWQVGLTVSASNVFSSLFFFNFLGRLKRESRAGAAKCRFDIQTEENRLVLISHLSRLSIGLN
jgi:hypothetical protein